MLTTLKIFDLVPQSWKQLSSLNENDYTFDKSNPSEEEIKRRKSMITKIKKEKAKIRKASKAYLAINIYLQQL